MKFYNLGDKIFETDFLILYLNRYPLGYFKQTINIFHFSSGFDRIQKKASDQIRQEDSDSSITGLYEIQKTYQILSVGLRSAVFK